MNNMRSHEKSPDPSRGYDVVIAGAGLSGGSLALRLARAGASVALVDSGKFPREKLCGEFLSPECWGVFERLGLEETIRCSGYHPIHRLRISTPRGRVLDTDFRRRDGLTGIGLSRSTLDNLIIGSCRTAGVDIYEGTQVKRALIRDGRVGGIVARQVIGEPFEVPAKVTVAADGRHSALVQRTGGTKARSWFRPRLFGLKRHLHVDESQSEPAGTVGLHLVPGGYVGACRVETGLTNLCGLLPESILRSRRGNLNRLADEIFPSNRLLDQMYRSGRPVDEWKTVSGVRVQISSPVISGILYAGDARGTIDPLGGQGMTMALLGAEMLAPFVLRALTEGLANASLQREYGKTWKTRFDQRISLCRAFHHVLVNPWLLDQAAIFSKLSPLLLALSFNQSRDSVSV